MKQILTLIVFKLFCVTIALAQGNYYSTIDTSSSSFVINLHNLIYPHTKITYYTTAVANYATRDTTDGKKVVTCVYSGENYVFTPPFSWGTYSREHTWCHSWMPTYPSESGPEYSDQHHLYPTNQNKANGIRSNHPLGIVVNPSYTYLQCKLGTNNLGYTVFEPRDSQKGDAARALFYMAVCYHGENGKDWSFNYLNTVTLPSKNEGPQDVALLKQWHQQDPPDAWEIARNDSVYKYQRNRNPFIDNPKWVDIIDFNTMTKIGTATYATEPTYHATNFNAGNITDSSITLAWSKAVAGTQLPSGYILFVRGDNSFITPGDGTVYPTDTTSSNIIKIINLSSNDSTFIVRNLQSATLYYFKLFSFNGDSSLRNYKTDGDVPNIFGQTTGTHSGIPDIVVNEYFNGSLQNQEWVELLVIKDKLDLRGYRVSDYSATGGEQAFVTFANIPFWEEIPIGTFLVLLASGNTQTQDFNISDKLIIVNVTNAAYFSSGSASFNIAGTSDAIQLRNSTGMHVHALGHGNNTNLNSIAMPKVIISGSSASGNIVRFKGVSTISDFNNNTKASHNAGTAATQGYANDSAQVIFINGLTTSVNSAKNDKLFPDKYLLFQNYPNPFNPSTIISYQLPVISNVILKIFDLLGREIETLVNEVQTPGRYSVQFNIGSSQYYIASGVYFYRLTAGKFTETRRMLIIK